MLRFARRLLDDPADAEDAVQDALVSAWRALDSFRGESAIRTWLLTLTSRRAVDLLRRRGALDSVSTDPADMAEITAGPRRPTGRDSDSDPYRQVAADELLAALDLALQSLPWRQRAVWLLREVEQMPYAQIAQVMSTTTPTVRGQLARARARLAELMASWR